MNRYGWVLASLLVLGVTMLSAAEEAVGRPRAAISAFWDLSPQALTTVQVKLTYMGSQMEPMTTVVFVVEGQAAEISRFTPFRRPGIPFFYENDDAGWIHVVHVPLEAVQRLLERLRHPPHPALTAGGAADEPFVSFAILATVAGGDQVYEAILDHDHAKALHPVLWQAFAGCRPALFELQGWGCPLGLLPPGRATDVTDAVAVMVSHFQRDPQTGYSAGRVQVKNRSPTVIPAPLSVVFELSNNGHVVDPDGTTCHVEPVGREFVHVPLTSTALAPGAQAEVPVILKNDEAQDPVVFSVKVVAGEAPR